eukprot:11022251-Ditylum_brightwellii.AAC.2
MASAGNCSIEVNVPETCKGASEIRTLFNEEAGIVVEAANEDANYVLEAYKGANVPPVEIGTASSGGDSIKISIGGGAPCIDDKMTVLCDVWEATSFQLEKHQRNPECAVQKEVGPKS